MNLIYKNELKDFINFQMFQITNSKEKRRAAKIKRYLIAIIPFFMFIYCLKDIFIIKNSIDRRIVFYNALLSILLEIICIYFYPKIYYWNLKKQISYSYNSDNKICLEINNEGVIDYKEKGFCKILWHAVDKVELTSEYLHIFISNSNIYIIPLSVIEKPDELEVLLNNVSKDKNINFQKIC